MELLVSIAYGVSDKEIVGGPGSGWPISERYDVTAKPEGDLKLTYEELKPRMQQLLAQRFKFAVHRQTKDFQGYALVVAKGGSKLKASEPNPKAQGIIWARGIRQPSATMETLAAMLARPAGRPIVDKTGIQGTYNIDLSFMAVDDPKSELPSIFTAVQEQLGLKLENAKVPVEMLVIDHVEKTPSEN